MFIVKEWDVFDVWLVGDGLQFVDFNYVIYLSLWVCIIVSFFDDCVVQCVIFVYIFDISFMVGVVMLYLGLVLLGMVVNLVLLDYVMWFYWIVEVDCWMFYDQVFLSVLGLFGFFMG